MQEIEKLNKKTQLDLLNIKDSEIDGTAEKKIVKKTNDLIVEANSHEERLKTLEGARPLNIDDSAKLNKFIRSRAMDFVGGKDSNAYRSNYYKKIIKKLRDNLNENFKTDSNKDIKANQLGEAIEFIKIWDLDLATKRQVMELNTSKQRVQEKHAFQFTEDQHKRIEELLTDEAYERFQELIHMPQDQFDRLTDKRAKNEFGLEGK